MGKSSKLNAVPDDELLRRLSDLVGRSRRVDADVVEHIAEVDARKIYAREAVPSMYAYCTQVLRLGEFEAYLRITAARASREYPVLLTMLRDGRLHLTAVARLASHLTPENSETLLKRAANRSKREIEELIAELDPKPDVRAAIRKLPVRAVEAAANRDAGRRGGATVAKPISGRVGQGELVPERVELPALRVGVEEVLLLPTASASTAASCLKPFEVLAPSRHKVQFTASDELRDKLERLQALMRTTVPDGDLATIIDLAVTEKLERLEAKRFGKTKNPRKRLEATDTTPSSRDIPAPVRRAVYERDGGRCTYLDRNGKRCTAREWLEYHHEGVPFGRGGDHDPRNVVLMCRTHNGLLAEIDYGTEKMARYRRRWRSEGRVSEPTSVYGRAGVGGAGVGDATESLRPPPKGKELVAELKPRPGARAARGRGQRELVPERVRPRAPRVSAERVPSAL
jgi:hypothetical protein